MKMSVQGRRRSAAIGLVSAAAVAGALVMAAPASAHTPKWSVGCDKVSVDLTNYVKGRQGKTNHVTLKIVSGEGALVDQDFATSFHYQDALPSHDQPLTLNLVVTSWDHSGQVNEKKTAPVCEGHTTPPTTATTTPPTTAPTTEPPTTAPTTPETTAPTTPAPSDTTTAPVAAASTSPASGSGDLAETGSSNATPMIAGIAAVVVVVGGGLVFWTRRRSGSSHR